MSVSDTAGEPASRPSGREVFNELQAAAELVVTARERFTRATSGIAHPRIDEAGERLASAAISLTNMRTAGLPVRRWNDAGVQLLTITIALVPAAAAWGAAVLLATLARVPAPWVIAGALTVFYGADAVTPLIRIRWRRRAAQYRLGRLTSEIRAQAGLTTLAARPGDPEPREPRGASHEAAGALALVSVAIMTARGHIATAAGIRARYRRFGFRLSGVAALAWLTTRDSIAGRMLNAEIHLCAADDAITIWLAT